MSCQKQQVVIPRGRKRTMPQNTLSATLTTKQCGYKCQQQRIAMWQQRVLQLNCGLNTQPCCFNICCNGLHREMLTVLAMWATHKKLIKYKLRFEQAYLSSLESLPTLAVSTGCCFVSHALRATPTLERYSILNLTSTTICISKASTAPEILTFNKMQSLVVNVHGWHGLYHHGADSRQACFSFVYTEKKVLRIHRK